MCHKFVRKGYPTCLLQEYKINALITQRDKLLHRTSDGQPKVKHIPLVSIFGPMSGQISHIVRQHWGLLQKGCPEVEGFKQLPLMSYKRDSSVRTDVGPQKPIMIQCTFVPAKMGNFPCLHCACCNNLTKGDSLTHPYSGRQFQIKQRYTCTSNYVIYLIKCPCGMCYVGETTQEVFVNVE